MQYLDIDLRFIIELTQSVPVQGWKCHDISAKNHLSAASNTISGGEIFVVWYFHKIDNFFPIYCWQSNIFSIFRVTFWKIDFTSTILHFDFQNFEVGSKLGPAKRLPKLTGTSKPNPTHYAVVGIQQHFMFKCPFWVLCLVGVGLHFILKKNQVKWSDLKALPPANFAFGRCLYGILKYKYCMLIYSYYNYLFLCLWGNIGYLFLVE